MSSIGSYSEEEIREVKKRRLSRNQAKRAATSERRAQAAAELEKQ
jgi:hypothetical protein